MRLSSLGLPVLALALAACSGAGSTSASSSPASTTPQTVTGTTATPSAPPSGSAGASATATAGGGSPSASGSGTATTGTGGTAEFVRVVRARVPEVAAGRSTAGIAAIATTACRSLRAGRPAEQVQAEARSLGTLDAEATDDATARELVKLAIDTTCLDQAGRVDEF